MTEQWRELKETITELRDNDGTGTQQEVCKFLVNYMDVLEKQMQEPCEDVISRKEVLNQIFYSTDNSGDVVLGSVLRHRIENLPSVKPQEPILDKIRAEIDRIEINGLVDEHTMFVRGGEEVKQMALNIIDKYKTESEENNAK